MDLILNLTVTIGIYFLFSLSLYGYGIIFKNIFLDKLKFNIGETGILGFIFVYFIVLVLNFFTPIKLEISFSLLLLGFIYFFYKLNKKLTKKYNKFIFFIIFVFSFIISITINLHDDAYWYHLPYINYLQSYKIIFGITNINQFIYGQSFYDLMSFFKIPQYNNRFIYLLPVIFLMYFMFYLYEIYNDNKDDKDILFLIIFISSIIFFRYTRSKEFGIDLPAQLLMVMFFLNCFFYNKNLENIFFYKSLLFIAFGILVKIYVIFSIPFLLIYLGKFRNIFNDIINKKKKFITFIILLLFLSIIKNFINSGCLLYPVTKLCFDKDKVAWSPGKNFINKIESHLKANSKGYNTYTKQAKNNEILDQQEYLKKYKYSYYQFWIKDKDTERLLIIVLIFIILLIVNNKNSNNYKPRLTSKSNNLIIYALFSILLWFFIGGLQSRYGGNFILCFSLFLIAYKFNLIKLIKIKKFYLYIIIFGLIYSLGKNLNRIKKEYTNLDEKNKKTYPISKFKIVNYQINKDFIIDINISNHPVYCHNIQMLCSTKSNFKSIESIKYKKNYLFISSNQNKKIESLNTEQKFITNKYYSR